MGGYTDYKKGDRFSRENRGSFSSGGSHPKCLTELLFTGDLVLAKVPVRQPNRPSTWPGLY